MTKLKNLVTDKTKYVKSDSIIGLEVDEAKKNLVIENLKKVSLGTIADSSRKEIVQTAIDCLLNDRYVNTQSNVKFELHTNVLEELSRISIDSYERYLFYRFRYEVFPQIKMLDEFPPCIQVEPTSICNFRCVFCYQTDEDFTDKKNDHMGSMPLELFKKIIDEARGKCESITLASRGEPLVNREIGAMLAYMGDDFLASKMNTNASLLTEKICHEILASGLKTLVFSADAADEKLYAELRVNGSLQKVLKNVQMFNRIKKEHYSNSQLITRVSGVLINESQSILEMKSFWGDLVDQVAFVNYNPWENTYERGLSGENSPCSDLWRRAFIWYDGRMNPCDVDYKTHLEVGNVYKNSISEIWQSHAYSKLRDQHMTNQRANISPCNKCTQV